MGPLYRSDAVEATLRGWCRDRLARWSTPHTTERLDTPLGDTHLTSAGGGGDLCVYLPGTNFNAATSTALLTLLAARCRVVCVDLPGQPGLSAAARPGDGSRYGEWLAAVVGHCRSVAPVERVVLAGHSRGAALALAAQPELVDSLVLVSPAGLASVRITPALLARSTAWLLRPTERRSARVVELMAGPGPVGDLDVLVQWMTLVARSTRTTGAPGPLPRDELERWRGHEVRVLVGEHDPFFPPGRLTPPARDHLGARIEVVAGAGHLLVDQRPQAVANAIVGARSA